MDAYRFRRWGGKIGLNTRRLITAVLASRPHPEQGFRTCLGILHLYLWLIRRAPKWFRPAPSKSACSLARVSPLSSRPQARRVRRETQRPNCAFDHADLRGPGHYICAEKRERLGLAEALAAFTGTLDRYTLADLILSPKDFGIRPAA